MDAQYANLNYSVRRYFVDEFHFRHVPLLSPDSSVLDLGGNKIGKRGQFDIERYDLRVVYANLSNDKRPDVQTDAARVPFQAACFDAVICSELLEHVPDPRAVLREAYRVLRGGGKLLICAPFLQLIHAAPYDYGRYTDYFWLETLAQVGFSQIEIEHQGLFFSVLAEMLKQLAKTMAQEGKPRSRLLRYLVRRCVAWGQRKVFELETKPHIRQHDLFQRYSTGFGIVCQK